MKSKHLLITAIFSALFFALGFFINRPSENSEVLADTTAVKSTTEEPVVTTDQTPEKSKTNYAKLLKGKFILARSDYAGYEFIDAKTISWTNELFPMDPDTMSIKWIDESTFITKFSKKTNKDCAPVIGVLKVVSYNDGKLVLKDYWTGWNDRKDELSTFHQSYE